MARTKETAKKTPGSKAPRKQLHQTASNRIINQKNRAYANGEFRAKELKNGILRKEQATYEQVLANYKEHECGGCELPMPPPMKGQNEGNEGTVGRPRSAARQCGLCSKIFSSLRAWCTHMVYRVFLGCVKLFCKVF